LINTFITSLLLAGSEGHPSTADLFLECGPVSFDLFPLSFNGLVGSLEMAKKSSLARKNPRYRQPIHPKFRAYPFLEFHSNL
jgi:hypothetical protein